MNNLINWLFRSIFGAFQSERPDILAVSGTGTIGRFRGIGSVGRWIGGDVIDARTTTDAPAHAQDIQQQQQQQQQQ